MKPLDPTPEPAYLLSFDFDGTLHDPAADPPVCPEFFTVIERLRAERRIIWGINTGRSLAQMLEGMLESRFPFLPDWVVAREREIYVPNAFGRWIPIEDWNRRCNEEHHRLFRTARELLRAIRHQIEEHTGAQWVEQDGEPAGIIARTDEEMEWIAGRVAELASGEPLLGWQRNSIYLRFGHRGYQKGSALAEVARRLGLGANETMAIGDSHNDLEMLDPAVAAKVACPANAVAEVRNQVLGHGGHVCTGSSSKGVHEALKVWFPE